MKALIWLHERAIAAVAAYRTRRQFRRHRLTPDAQKRLAEAKKRTTP